MVCPSSALAGGFQLCDYESRLPGSIPGKSFSARAGLRACAQVTLATDEPLWDVLMLLLLASVHGVGYLSGVRRW